MENTENNSTKPTQTPAFTIALIALFIVFIAMLTKLPFPRSYDFWPRAGICFVCFLTGGIIYSISVGLVELIYKVIVEISAALLLFGNMLYVACLWAYYKEVEASVMELGLPVDWEPAVTTIVVSAVILLIFNLVAVFFLYPMSRIANTKLLG